MKFETKAIHTGYQPDETGAIMPPIYMTSTFTHGSDYEYTRAGNPNFTMAEKLLASLEEAKHATVFSSGLGALSAFISTLEPGTKVAGIGSLYGGTYRLFTRVFQKFGIEFENVNELESVPDWILLETPTNPLLNTYDIEEFKRCGAKLVVDNTFATPYFQNPLLHGADLVWHSSTKYLGGHSDVVGGVMMTNDAEMKERLDFGRMAIGVNPSPFDVWLMIRGLKTLALRMERHQENAERVISFLEEKVKRLYCPRKSEQLRGIPGMVSAEFDLPLDQVMQILKNMKVFTLAESLGGVESLVCHPASMTHASIPKEAREKVGVTDGLVRFSVGIEAIDDLLCDIDQLLK